jgi:hypothetical protein
VTGCGSIRRGRPRRAAAADGRVGVAGTVAGPRLHRPPRPWRGRLPRPLTPVRTRCARWYTPPQAWRGPMVCTLVHTVRGRAYPCTHLAARLPAGAPSLDVDDQSRSGRAPARGTRQAAPRAGSGRGRASNAGSRSATCKSAEGPEGGRGLWARWRCGLWGGDRWLCAGVGSQCGWRGRGEGAAGGAPWRRVATSDVARPGRGQRGEFRQPRTSPETSPGDLAGVAPRHLPMCSSEPRPRHDGPVCGTRPGFRTGTLQSPYPYATSVAARPLGTRARRSQPITPGTADAGTSDVGAGHREGRRS